MSRKASDDSLANASLSTSRVPPQKGISGDGMVSTRNLPGNDQQKGLDAMTETKKKVGSNPASIPQEGKGGTNARGAGKTQGEEGNGAQKRKQKK